jgi:hypothetical protein
MNTLDHWSKTTLTASVITCALALAAPAHARPPSPPWSTDLELTSELPLGAGLRLGVEAPGRVRLGLTAGLIPAPYVGLINGAVVALGGYDEQVARLVELALDDSLIVRADLGWRPWAERGFYFAFAWRYVTFGGEVEGALIADLIQVNTPGQSRDYAYRVDTTLHMAELELGWQWTLPWDTILRAGLGFSAAFSSDALVDAIRVIDDYEDTATDRLNQIFDSYAWAPLITVGLGHRFRQERSP